MAKSLSSEEGSFIMPWRAANRGSVGLFYVQQSNENLAMSRNVKFKAIREVVS